MEDEPPNANMPFCMAACGIGFSGPASRMRRSGAELLRCSAGPGLELESWRWRLYR